MFKELVNHIDWYNPSGGIADLKKLFDDTKIITDWYTLDGNIADLEKSGDFDKFSGILAMKREFNWGSCIFKVREGKVVRISGDYVIHERYDGFVHVPYRYARWEIDEHVQRKLHDKCEKLWARQTRLDGKVREYTDFLKTTDDNLKLRSFSNTYWVTMPDPYNAVIKVDFEVFPSRRPKFKPITIHREHFVDELLTGKCVNDFMDVLAQKDSYLDRLWQVSKTVPTFFETLMAALFVK